MKNVHLNGLFQSSSLLYYFSKIPFGYSCFNGDVPANPPVDCFNSRILHYFKHSLKDHTKHDVSQKTLLQDSPWWLFLDFYE